ncbi:MAG: hypothetical protein QGG50_05760 [Methanopyri archaeon]|nr:hypothetical protein [Methanopyri archaeon]
MLLKDALSLARHRKEGRVVYRDGDGSSVIDITDLKKEGTFFRVDDALVPLHRIRRVDSRGEILWE